MSSSHRGWDNVGPHASGARGGSETDGKPAVPVWAHSELPFFVVLQEQPRRTLPASPLSASAAEDERLTTRYPEVKYVFEDDDFQPTVDVLEQQPGDVSVVIDFGPDGREIVGHKSLSYSWQGLSVDTQSSGAPSWVEQSEDSGATMLRITGTRADRGIPSFPETIKSGSETSQPDVNGINAVNALAEAFVERNRQLKQLLEGAQLGGTQD